ncbi:MAG: tetratricopeptide repeat protein [Acidobacteriota bacterium]|nr:MAG: tetratricopeptide repeat protein [Acidobacteriota bacterium]
MRHLAPLAALAVLSCSLSSTWSSWAASDVSPSKLRQAAAHTAKGDKALEAGNLERARKYYGKALDAVVDFADAHVGLGHIAMREQEFADALAAFERARDGYIVMGDALYNQKAKDYYDSQDKIRELQAALSSLRTQRPSASGATSDFRTQQRITQLETEIQRLQNTDPPSEAEAREVPGKIFFYIGNALSRLQRVEDATAAWEQCVEKDPDFAPVYNNLAVAYWQAQRLKEAQSCVEKAESLGVTVNPAFKAELQRSLRSRAD